MQIFELAEEQYRYETRTWMYFQIKNKNQSFSFVYYLYLSKREWWETKFNLHIEAGKWFLAIETME